MKQSLARESTSGNSRSSVRSARMGISGSILTADPTYGVTVRAVGSEDVHLLGLDVGSTRPGALTGTARIPRDPVKGRLPLHDEIVRHRLGPVLTPLRGDELDLDAIASLLDGWLAEAGLVADDLFAGGALVTGLAARRANADALAALVRE